ncbi:hypothetical protein O6H91_Y067700 [Diphasiastrum complanatum]|nr:hypothetical protein O6H91_Y067700 [Diphasiastrum complanatum]
MFLATKLSGSLPPRLFTLQLLESVSVRQNKLTGQLPPPSNSSRLMILDVESNGLNGASSTGMVDAAIARNPQTKQQSFLRKPDACIGCHHLGAGSQKQPF